MKNDLFTLENEYRKSGIIAGIDEAGRGPLAGPVVAACCVMPQDKIIEGIDDSKKLSEKKRELLFPKIMDSALYTGIGIVDNSEIDKINILNAAKRAFLLAYKDMGYIPQLILIDGRDIINIDTQVRSIIHGDALCYSIACASIIAKVTRDRLMREYAKTYPEYLFDKHKGYGTREHIERIREYGACEIHRRTFIKKIV